MRNKKKSTWHEYQEKRKAKGQCYSCGNFAEPNRTRCSNCRAKQCGKYDRIEQGICKRCKNPSLPGVKMCQVHAEANAKRGRKTRQCRKNSGDCYLCGKGPPIQGASICEKCWLEKAAKLHLGSYSRWHELKNLFDKQNICPYTGYQLLIGVNVSIDHIIPRAKGGLNEVDNLQYVYYGDVDINWMKGKLDDSEFKSIVLKIANHIQSTIIKNNQNKEIQ